MAWSPPPAVMSGLDPVGILAPRSRLAVPVPALSACTAIDVSPSAQVPVQARKSGMHERKAVSRSLRQLGHLLARNHTGKHYSATSPSAMITTRRFVARPSAVSFEAAGSDSPMPATSTSAAVML